MSPQQSRIGDQPHHDGSAVYVSQPYPQLGERVQVRFRAPHDAGVESAALRTTHDGEQRFFAAQRVAQDPSGDWWQVELECHNPVTHYRFLLDGPGGYRWLNGSGVHHRDVPDAADFRLVTFTRPPQWAPESVVYQVFPDRFARDASVEPAAGVGEPRTDLPDWALPAAWSEPVDPHNPEQVFGGTLDGITENLDHLVDLGVSVLYLTPFFPARSNHRYDAASFDEADPVLGGTAAMQRLQQAAHDRGIRVMGDITTNHTGDSHEWFRAAQEPGARESDWYVRHPETGEWETWLGVHTLPKLDHTNSQLREVMITGCDSVLRRWLAPGAGLDAWRVDVANMTGRYRDVDVALDVARDARLAVDEATDGQSLLVAEHVHDHSGDVVGDGWHGVMNYSGFTKPVWTWLRDPKYAPKFLGSPARVPRLGGALVAETMREFSAIVPWRSLLHSFTLLGSHDTSRVLTLVGQDVAQVEIAAGLLFTMPGIPMLTYGDEIGMLGDFGEDGRRPMPWGARDGSVEGWDRDLWQCYHDLIELRRTLPALATGGMRWLHAEDDALVYLREHPEGNALVHIARDAHDEVVIPLEWAPGPGAGSTRYGPEPAVDGDALRLDADGPVVRVWSFTGEVPQWSETAAEQDVADHAQAPAAGVPG